MMRLWICTVGLAVLWSVSVYAEDLAWRFDTSARPADLAVETTIPNAEVVDVAPSAEGVSGAIPLFDSRWTYNLLLEGWTYRHVSGLCFIFR